MCRRLSLKPLPPDAANIKALRGDTCGWSTPEEASTLFELPDIFVGDDFQPWNYPKVRSIDGKRFLVESWLSSDNDGACRGAIVFDNDAKVLHALYLDHEGALVDALRNQAVSATTKGLLLIDSALGPHGELALLFSVDDGLALYRTPGM